MDKMMFKVKEVAQLLGVNEHKVYELCKNGRMQHIRMGSNGRGVYRIPRWEVDRFMNLQKEGT